MSVDQDQLASERPADQDPHCKVQELTKNNKWIDPSSKEVILHNFRQFVEN